MSKADILPNPSSPTHRRPKAYVPWRNSLIIATVVALYWLVRDKRVYHSWRHHPTETSTTHASSPSRNPAYLVRAKSGAVASENEICSKMGIDVLKDGGNAIDSAVAVTLCIGVVNMFSSGIGGGGFMTVRLPPSGPNTGSEVWTIDFRETAPALANTTMYRDNPILSMVGGLSVGVPGELRGLEVAHNRWGKLPWKHLVQMTADLASEWKVTKELALRIRRNYFRSLMLDNPDWSAIFAPAGKLLAEGEIIRRTNYSRTLATIANEGVEAFYKGPIADSIIKKVQATGGIMTHADLLNYSVIVRPALRGTYLGRNVYTTHPPTSGPVLVHMLNLMEHYDLVGDGATGLNIHRTVEAQKFGFAARTKVCDPAFSKKLDQMDILVSKEFADLIVANITDDSTHTPDYYNPEFDIVTDHGTSHSSIVDKDGMVVAVTSTVNLVFGSQVMDPETGIIMNDEMDDFSTPGTPNGFGLYPSPFNYPEPWKRPLSSIAPTIIEHPDGSFYLATGASGGSRIFGSIFQVILNLDWGMDMGQAIEFGRLHDQLFPSEVDADSIYPSDLLDALRERGHNVTVSDITRVAAVVQGVMSDGEYLWAASDSRKNGISAGY